MGPGSVRYKFTIKEGVCKERQKGGYAITRSVVKYAGPKVYLHQQDRVG